MLEICCCQSCCLQIWDGDGWVGLLVVIMVVFGGWWENCNIQQKKNTLSEIVMKFTINNTQGISNAKIRGLCD